MPPSPSGPPEEPDRSGSGCLMVVFVVLDVVVFVIWLLSRA